MQAGVAELARLMANAGFFRAVLSLLVRVMACWGILLGTHIFGEPLPFPACNSGDDQKGQVGRGSGTCNTAEHSELVKAH